MSEVVRISRKIYSEIVRLVEMKECNSIRECVDELLKIGLMYRDKKIVSQQEALMELEIMVKQLKNQVRDLIQKKNELMARVNILETVNKLDQLLSKLDSSYNAEPLSEELIDELSEIKTELRKNVDLYFALAKARGKKK